MIRGPGNNPSKRRVPEETGDDTDTNGPLPERSQKLEYVRQMLLELRQIAEETGEGTLVYMIEMAMMEAEECRRSRERATRMER